MLSNNDKIQAVIKALENIPVPVGLLESVGVPIFNCAAVLKDIYKNEKNSDTVNEEESQTESD